MAYNKIHFDPKDLLAFEVLLGLVYYQMHCMLEDFIETYCRAVDDVIAWNGKVAQVSRTLWPTTNMEKPS